MSLIAVIIPFYQDQPGLLTRAVQSVIYQTGMVDHTVHVVVVDDSSPYPATSELGSFDVAIGTSIEIVHKTNGGPGSARNAGISRAVDQGADYVAFLDSDDWWAPEHLCKAVNALINNDGGFYCSNSMHDDVTSFSYFRANQILTANENAMTRLGMIPWDIAFDIVLSECVTHTSQVVYDLPRHSKLRFDERFRRTGEDHLFWLSILSAKSPLHYTTEVMGFRGRGVSVYRESLDRNTLPYFNRLLEVAQFRKLVSTSINLSIAQNKINAGLRQDALDEISYAIVRFAARDPTKLVAALKRLGAEPQQGLFSKVLLSFFNWRRTRRRLSRTLS